MKELENIGKLKDNFFGYIDTICQDYKKDIKDAVIIDDEGYELDENGNRLSCCGTPLDPDYMICSECREHC